MQKFSEWPNFTDEEAKKVSEVLLSNKVNYWTGDQGQEFEKEFASFVGSRYAVAVANGTLALELALRGLNIGPGDEVVVTSRSFIASASCVVAVGANPVFADVDANSQNITADTIVPVLTPRTRAVVCVHLAGWPCNMESIISLADKYNLYVIEDCAQAHGAKLNGVSVGSFGHVGAWSFCQDKIITTAGEGGMITTSDTYLWEKIWALKDHGKSRSIVHQKEQSIGFRWLHESFGTNARMTEIQAAIGRIQLRKLEDWQRQRKKNADQIIASVRDLQSIRIPDLPNNLQHAFYRCYLFVEPALLKAGWNRDRILAQLLDSNIPVGVGVCPEIYREIAFQSLKNKVTHRLPNAKRLGETSLAFSVHPNLRKHEIEIISEKLKSLMHKATR